MRRAFTPVDKGTELANEGYNSTPPESRAAQGASWVSVQGRDESRTQEAYTSEWPRKGWLHSTGQPNLAKHVLCKAVSGVGRLYRPPSSSAQLRRAGAGPVCE